MSYVLFVLPQSNAHGTLYRNGKKVWEGPWSGWAILYSLGIPYERRNININPDTHFVYFAENLEDVRVEEFNK
jgi:hypothetical protein